MSFKNADPQEYLRALDGLDFPASLPAIVRRARDTGGLDTEVMFVLERMPERTYASLDDIGEEIRRVYDEVGGLPDGGPAAPSGVTGEAKGLTERVADPRGFDSPPSKPSGGLA